MVEGVADGGGDGDDGGFAGADGGDAGGLDQDGFDVGHIAEARHAILGKARVEDFAVLEFDLLEEGAADAQAIRSKRR